MKGLEWVGEIKVVGFDLDGTLYPPGTIPAEIFEEERVKQVSRMNGWDEQRTKREYEKICMQLGSHTKTMTALGVDGEDFFVKLWDELALEGYLHKDEKLMTMLGGLRERGLGLFVLSNSNREDQIERKLRLIGVEPEIFEVIVSTVGMEAVKPDVRPFLEAVERLNRIRNLPAAAGKFLELKPRQILYVGDRDSTDIIGAKRVGMKSCLVWGRSELSDVSLPTVYGLGKLFL